MNPKLVADRLGHSTVSITLNVYSDSIPEVEAVEAAEDIAAAAQLSAEVYILQWDGGARELLYGVSVYARRPGADTDVLIRFSASPCFLEVSVGVLRAAGFPVVPTGADPGHFDVQLLPGHPEDDPADESLVAGAASRLVARAGDLHHNPFYADVEPEGIR